MARGNEEKKGHPVRNTAIAAALVAMLIGGGRLGAGLGKSVGESMFLNQGKEPENTGTAQTETVQQEQPSPETAETPDDGVLEIVVREDAVLYEGEQTDLAGLEAALLVFLLTVMVLAFYDFVANTFFDFAGNIGNASWNDVWKAFISNLPDYIETAVSKIPIVFILEMIAREYQVYVYNRKTAHPEAETDHA